ncbi:hypothetical protein G6O69_28495 [Pseudenhygromyxa sp. WMMC2535]|uniref:hypothetical protein n=1 Tax=Pseudenhygromyxa sp. WMMC2535 TaxID=2712867 RepID=UPI001557C24F|nr:hypothetical protein [Pseudenhygromyxa sp. WMMC2535]NVB41806.1 hypothetical protein [Pseudenhygromyxa sp. WMMC2535]
MANETLRALIAKVLERADLPLSLAPALADLLKLDVEFNEGFLRLKETANLEAFEASLEVGDAIYKDVADAVATIEERGDFSALERAVAVANHKYQRLQRSERGV